MQPGTPFGNDRSLIKLFLGWGGNVEAQLLCDFTVRSALLEAIKWHKVDLALYLINIGAIRVMAADSRAAGYAPAFAAQIAGRTAAGMAATHGLITVFERILMHGAENVDFEHLYTRLMTEKSLRTQCLLPMLRVLLRHLREHGVHGPAGRSDIVWDPTWTLGSWWQRQRRCCVFNLALEKLTFDVRAQEECLHLLVNFGFALPPQLVFPSRRVKDILIGRPFLVLSLRSLCQSNRAKAYFRLTKWVCKTAPFWVVVMICSLLRPIISS
jgi:hypothetical protein